jgi:RimJ/RimL family protein N-acetyltransferase
MIDLDREPDGLRATVVFEPAGHRLDEVVAEARSAIDSAHASGVRQVRWRAPLGDEGSRRVAWACGFTFEGSLRGDWYADGHLTDSWTATLLADDSREPKTRWLDAVELTAPGVVLRDQAPGDRDRYVETMADPETLIWLGSLALPSTPDEFDRMLASRHVGASMGHSVAWTVAEPETDTYLATINVFGFATKDYRSAEVGYRTHPDARGRGVLSTALRRVIAHAFTPETEGGLGLGRLSLGAGDGNAASQGVARACGFVETGRDRRCYDRYDGSVVDLIRFDLLPDDPSLDRSSSDTAG